MRTRVEVVACGAPGGRTALSVLAATGQLAVRRTGPETVHLVSAAAGPLGGDTVSVVLRVEDGARLAVRSVAASIVLPHRSGAPALSTVDVTVGDGASLDLALCPTVVAARAEWRGTLRVRLAAGAILSCTEQVVLGRAGEGPGRWEGTVRVERAGRPVLVSTVHLGPGADAWLPPFTPRAYVSTLRLGPPPAPEDPPGTGESAVRLPLPGGHLLTGWGADLTDVLTATALLDRSAPTPAPDRASGHGARHCSTATGA